MKLFNRNLKIILIFCIFSIVLGSTPMATAKTITVDGDTSDWTGISPIITDPNDYTWDGLDVKEVYMTHDADYLYVRIDFYGIFSANAGVYSAYLDTDLNPGTGSPVSDIGVEVQFGVYSGSGYGYFPLTGSSFSVSFASSGSVLEFRAAFSDLGNPSSFDFVVMCYPNDGGTPTASYVIGSNPQTITVDGDGGDWTGSSFFTDASGDAVSDGLDLTESWVGDDGANLYFRLDTLGIINPSATGDIWLSYDTSFPRVPFTNYVTATVIEGWIPLADLGNPPPSEVFPMVYVMALIFENAPDTGHETYLRTVGDVGDRIFNAMENSVYFVPTGNIYDDSAFYAFYWYKSNPQIITPPTQSSASSAYLDVDGSPFFTGDIVTFGGRYANRMVAYFEDVGVAVVGFLNNGTHRIFRRISDGAHLYAVDFSTYNESEKDYFVIQVYGDGDRYILSMWGIRAPGTYAGGTCFIDIVCPNIEGCTDQYYIFSWTDSNGDGMPQSGEINLETSGR